MYMSVKSISPPLAKAAAIVPFTLFDKACDAMGKDMEANAHGQTINGAVYVEANRTC